MSEGTIPAPGRIEIGDVLAFAEGDPVPTEQAVQLYNDGNWPGDTPPPGAKKTAARKAAKRARKPAEDRARKLREDRSK